LAVHGQATFGGQAQSVFATGGQFTFGGQAQSVLGAQGQFTFGGQAQSVLGAHGQFIFGGQAQSVLATQGQAGFWSQLQSGWACREANQARRRTKSPRRSQQPHCAAAAPLPQGAGAHAGLAAFAGAVCMTDGGGATVEAAGKDWPGCATWPTMHAAKSKSPFMSHLPFESFRGRAASRPMPGSNQGGRGAQSPVVGAAPGAA
jgi:hypothetical protein